MSLGILLTPPVVWALATAEPDLDDYWTELDESAQRRAEAFAIRRGWIGVAGRLTPRGDAAVDEVLAAFVEALGEPVPLPPGAA